MPAATAFTMLGETASARSSSYSTQNLSKGTAAITKATHKHTQNPLDRPTDPPPGYSHSRQLAGAQHIPDQQQSWPLAEMSTGFVISQPTVPYPSCSPTNKPAALQRPASLRMSKLPCKASNISADPEHIFRRRLFLFQIRNRERRPGRVTGRKRHVGRIRHLLFSTFFPSFAFVIVP